MNYSIWRMKMIREYFELRRKKEKFENLMLSMGLDKFYLIEDVKITNGHILKVGIPSTSSFKKFEEKKQQLEDHFKGIVEIEKVRFSSMIQMKIITKDLGKYPFSIVKTYPNNLFIAREFDRTPFFIDLDKEGHVLVAGQSGTGKTFLLSSILTNLIATNGDYIEGMVVIHDRFGQGVIKSIEGSGKNQKLTINFENSGEKKILSLYAKLTIK